MFPRFNDPYDERDFVRALQCFCKEEANDNELWFIYAALSAAYADESIANLFHAIATVAREDVVRRKDGKVVKRLIKEASTFRSVKLRTQKKLNEFLSEYYSA